LGFAFPKSLFRRPGIAKDKRHAFGLAARAGLGDDRFQLHVSERSGMSARPYLNLPERPAVWSFDETSRIHVLDSTQPLLPKRPG
jgi:hypothetical protein